MSYLKKKQKDLTLPMFRVAEIQVSYTPRILFNNIKIKSALTSYSVLTAHWENIEYEERVYVLLLNRDNRVLGLHLHSIGGVYGTVFNGPKILGIVYASNASSFIVAHNHPSGNLNPSEADDKRTEELLKASVYQKKMFLDHLIVTSKGYCSYADENRLNF